MRNINDNNVVKLVIIFIGLLIFFGSFYSITYFATRYRRPNLEYGETPIQNETILVGNILNRRHEEYYVVATTRDDDSFGRYKELLDNLKEATLIPNYYVVDLDDPFNSNFLSEEEKLDVERTSEFQFNGPTLIKVNNGQVENSWVGSLEIISYLASK